MKETIHFAHGNGFPSPCYQQVLKRLQTRFNVCYIDRIGHSPDYPVTDNWHQLVEELIQSVKEQASQPVIAVGHSLGGVLSFRAAVAEPSLFKAVILLDAPILGHIKSRLIKLTKKLGLIERVSPAFRTRSRRQHWQDKEQAIHYLRSKPLFKSFADECLNDYIQYGMKHDANGYSLRFDRDIEFQIYRTMPHILHKYKGKLRIPTALVYGDKSKVIDKIDLHNMVKNHNIKCYRLKGGHMFPMERPENTANLIFKALDDLLELDNFGNTN